MLYVVPDAVRFAGVELKEERLKPFIDEDLKRAADWAALNRSVEPSNDSAEDPVGADDAS